MFTIYCICSIICYHYYYYLYLHVDLNTYCQSKVCMLLRIFILTWDMLADLYAFIYRYIVNLLWYIYRCTWRCLVSTLVCVEFQSCALLSVFMFAICKNSDRRNINWDLDTVTNYMKTLTYFPWDFPFVPWIFPWNDPCFAFQAGRCRGLWTNRLALTLHHVWAPGEGRHVGSWSMDDVFDVTVSPLSWSKIMYPLVI